MRWSRRLDVRVRRVRLLGQGAVELGRCAGHSLGALPAVRGGERVISYRHPRSSRTIASTRRGRAVSSLRARRAPTRRRGSRRARGSDHAAKRGDTGAGGHEEGRGHVAGWRVKDRRGQAASLAPCSPWRDRPGRPSPASRHLEPRRAGRLDAHRVGALELAVGRSRSRFSHCPGSYVNGLPSDRSKTTLAPRGDDARGDEVTSNVSGGVGIGGGRLPQCGTSGRAPASSKRPPLE